MSDETNTNEQKLTPTLTDRQLQMLAMASVGLTNQQIADELSLAVSTIANTLKTVYRKLGVRNRVLAVRWMIEQYGEV